MLRGATCRTVQAIRAQFRRPSRTRPELERLERREVLSASGSPPFATLHGAVTHAGKPAHVVFRLDTGTFVSDRPIPMQLCLEAVPAAGSSVQPKVTRIVSLNEFGIPAHGVPTRPGPFVTNIEAALARPTVYEVSVAGQHATTGAFVLQAFLPGDVNGDGVVDRTDVGRVRAAYGTDARSHRFDAAADVNGDGTVGRFDFGITRRNLGARASIVALAEPTPKGPRRG